MIYTQAHVDGLRAELEWLGSELNAAQYERDALRADFKRADGLMDAERERADFNLSELEDARATISRVRSVLDEMDAGDFPTGKSWADDIRTALDGDLNAD